MMSGRKGPQILNHNLKKKTLRISHGGVTLRIYHTAKYATPGCEAAGSEVVG